ncbi:hypothetical protein GOP47_0027620 [Adiantum capillus-veneris]|nr:hypothetical protein GOP47_0027620 [Adiantum capillus-veneris]
MKLVKPTWVLLLLSLWQLVAVSSRFVVEKNSLTVLAPSSLIGQHDSAIGNFGAPDYGGSMILDVKVPEKHPDGCKPFPDNLFKRKSSKTSPIVALLDRGGCYFALKVWNAQNAGAASVLIADDRVEPLITMDSPEEDDKAAEYVQKITIPSALIEKKFGDKVKAELAKKETITVKLDWSESLPHPDEQVEYELWTSSTDECGAKCNTLAEFIKSFKGAAQLLEKGGHTKFTPHYITWYCPNSFSKSKQCHSECINHGRYCAPDPEQDLKKGYEGKDVVMENLRQLCVYKVANASGKPWVWWDFVSDFHIRCPMKDKKYDQECAEEVMHSLGLPKDEVEKCMGHPDADEDNPLLTSEQNAQVGQGPRGDVTILPTLIVNGRQYRGKLAKSAVLKAICAGFKESTEPAVCLSHDMQTNECLNKNGGCWKNKEANVTACKDTFRGRICECPIVQGVQFQGDGYTYCEAIGPGRCSINNGGCWKETRHGRTFSACQSSHLKGCECPEGFRGDGRNHCEDIDECAEKAACQCPECKCKDKWGGYECSCKGKLLYMKEQDTCIGKGAAGFTWLMAFLAGWAIFAVAAAVGYFIYRKRLRSYMDGEIRAIMAQYMPLETEDEGNHLLESTT